MHLHTKHGQRKDPNDEGRVLPKIHGDTVRRSDRRLNPTARRTWVVPAAGSGHLSGASQRRGLRQAHTFAHEHGYLNRGLLPSLVVNRLVGGTALAACLLHRSCTPRAHLARTIRRSTPPSTTLTSIMARSWPVAASRWRKLLHSDRRRGRRVSLQPGIGRHTGSLEHRLVRLGARWRFPPPRQHQRLRLRQQRR